MSSPTIPADEWRLITIGCRDQEEVRRVLAGYQTGHSRGQRSMADAMWEASSAAICTPQPPSEEPKE